jgi:hypothetical protein
MGLLDSGGDVLHLLGPARVADVRNPPAKGLR